MDVCYYMNCNIDGNRVRSLLLDKIPGKIKASFSFFFGSGSSDCRLGKLSCVDAFGLLICQEANHLRPHYLLPAIDY